MANITLPQVLKAPVVTRVISRIRTPQQVFQRFLGCLPGGPNINPVGGNATGWDIMDNVRDIATGRDLDSGPATVALQKIGHVSATMWRGHEKKHLEESRLYRTRPLGRPWGEIDNRGQRYVTRQEETLAQRFYNAREFMISRMFRGGFDLDLQGDNILLRDAATPTSPEINYRVPAGNLGECEMTDLDANKLIPTSYNAAQQLFDNGTATLKWSDTTNAPILTQMHLLNAAFEVQHGMPLRHVWINSSTWVWVINNTEIRNACGSANAVWTDYRVSPGWGDPGDPDRINGNTSFDIVLRPMPWLTWHVYDGGLKVWDGTSAYAFAKFVPDDHAYFCPDPSPVWFELHEGSELVRENVVAQSTERFGLAGWAEPTTQPSGFDLIEVDNCLPALYIPRAVVDGTINFP